MRKSVKHWILPPSEKTLCGRVPKGREVDPAWPVCKNCDRSTVLKYATRTYKFSDEQIEQQKEELRDATLPDGTEPKFKLFFTEMSVTRLHD